MHVFDIRYEAAQQKQVVNFRRQQGVCRLKLGRRDTEGVFCFCFFLLGGALPEKDEDSVHNGCQPKRPTWQIGPASLPQKRSAVHGATGRALRPASRLNQWL